MSIVEKLILAFPDIASASAVDEAFILANPSIIELPGPVDLLQVVPAYMLWCTKHPEDPALVSDGTLHALAEYGRCKSPDNTYLNFRYLCCRHQIEAVSAFLDWAQEALPFHNKAQLERARHNWAALANIAFKTDGFAAA